MGERLATSLVVASVLGSGLVAGVFYAFSTFVMAALARLPAPEGMAAMRSINITVINPWFMAAFFGTAVACLALVVVSLMGWREPGAAWLLAGGLLYLAGAVLVTGVCNVPLNDALAAANPDDPAGAALWARYVDRWTAWNHVRCAASLAAAACFLLALQSPGRAP